jgi:hypothetical protein
MYADDQLGKLIAWLGPEGLKRTVIVFTSDNGTVASLLPQRQMRNGVQFPHDGRYDEYAGTAPSPYTAEGKISGGETGMNVPFIVAHGPVPDYLRGTTSDARMNFADLAETLPHLVAPEHFAISDIYVEGRDFSSLIRGGAADQDRLFGITVSSRGDEGLITVDVSTEEALASLYDYSGASMSAVADPDANGDIYRLQRRPGTTFQNVARLADTCDVVINLYRNVNSDIRTEDVGEVPIAITALQAAIQTVYPGSTEGGQTGPDWANLTSYDYGDVVTSDGKHWQQIMAAGCESRNSGTGPDGIDMFFDATCLWLIDTRSNICDAPQHSPV